MKEAMLWERLGQTTVECKLCPHNCKISEGKRGICGVRVNIEGKLFSLNYGKVISSNIDPIEKKPLFHFLPGSQSYSIACPGCNFSCLFCQNWEISQMSKGNKPITGEEIKPDKIVEDAIRNHCRSIAYTYTEPTIFFEYAYDCARLAAKKGLKNVFVTNGYITKEAIDKIAPYLDAANLDLKGFSEDFYKGIVGGRLKPVLDAIKYMHKNGIFIEITTLIVPGHNDSDEMLEKIADFIVSIDKDIPWHISKFYPHFKMLDKEPTEESVIKRAIEIGKQKGLKHIYAGNIHIKGADDSYCPRCGKTIIKRRGYFVEKVNLDLQRCKFCGEKVNVVTE